MKISNLSATSIMVTLFAMSTHSTAALAQDADDGVIFDPIPDGGSLFTVEPKGFEIDLDAIDGELSPRALSVPVSPNWRYTCFATTPWLPVPDASDVSIYPNLDLTWLGLISLLSKDDTGLMNFVLESRSFGEDEIERKYFGVDTGMMDLSPLFFPDDRSCVYLGNLQTSIDSDFPVVYQSELKGETEVRGMFCGLMSGAKLELFGLSLRILPKNQ